MILVNYRLKISSEITVYPKEFMYRKDKEREIKKNILKNLDD